MSTLCIIPARGGSKRIPRKNVRPLLGRPLITWPISTAKASGLFDEIMVSTDDDEIAAIARSAGAAVPFMRSAGTSHDHASTTAVIQEVLANYQKIQSLPFTTICCVYPTAALLEPAHLSAGYSLLTGSNTFDSAMSVQRYRHPIERAYHLTDGKIQPVDIEKLNVRTQDLTPAFHDAGQFYWFRPKSFAENGRLLGKSCAPVFLETWQAVDLDTEDDWNLLERLASTRAPQPTSQN